MRLVVIILVQPPPFTETVPLKATKLALYGLDYGSISFLLVLSIRLSLDV